MCGCLFGLGGVCFGGYVKSGGKIAVAVSSEGCFRSETMLVSRAGRGVLEFVWFGVVAFFSLERGGLED